MASKVFNLKGVGTPGSVSYQQLQDSAALFLQLISTLEYSIDLQAQYIQTLCKFSYLTQRVFLYLIYQGFCGQEEEGDPEVEPPSDLEQEEGCGLGDGQGGEQNITDQIEHEEQLEGLKNYESEEEK